MSYMKKGQLIALFLFFLVAGLGVSFLAWAQTEEEKIELFFAEISLGKNGEVAVQETIRYDFGDLERHGIYREIPLRSAAGKKLKITVEGVTDERGNSYPVESSGNTILRIQIGDPYRVVSGKHTYIISYTVNGAVGFFEDFDELYWNVTGNDWQIPIKEAQVRLTLPENISPERIQSSCYVGIKGSNASCWQGSNYENGAYTASVSNLAPGEGLTIAVGFPKGIITKPWQEQVWEWMGIFWKGFLAIVFPGVFLFSFLRWYRYGRDPKGRGVIIPEYDVPENLSVLEVAALNRIQVQGLNAKAITAGILELAVQGFLKIAFHKEKKIFIDSKDYLFTRTEKGAETEVQRALLRALFGTESGAGIEIALSSLKNKFYKDIPTIAKAARESLIEKGFYAKKSSEPSVKKALVAVALLVIIILTGVFGLKDGFLLEFTPWWGMVALIASLVTAIFFTIFMEKVTPAGALLRDQIRGLKEYLQIAEKNRLAFHNAPEKSPALFEKLLPAAVVLGVDEAWAKEFTDLTLTPPSWYSGPSTAHFSAQSFVADLVDFSQAASASLSAPSNSGSGGGGFSGGGGGGGGGGSW